MPVASTKSAKVAYRGRAVFFVPGSRRGFTLVEAMLSVAIISIAGTALITGIASSINTTDAAMQQAIGLGLAEQLMDEIASRHYAEPGGSPTTTLGPEAGETSSGSRSLFDDLDDYNGLIDQPPSDVNGFELGKDNGSGGERNSNFKLPVGQLAGWRREVTVAYVSDADFTTPLSGGITSNFRLVEVRVFVDNSQGGSREVARLSRVFAYVPIPQ